MDFNAVMVKIHDAVTQINIKSECRVLDKSVSWSLTVNWKNLFAKKKTTDLKKNTKNV